MKKIPLVSTQKCPAVKAPWAGDAAIGRHQSATKLPILAEWTDPPVTER
jgi:hypothetical protein